MLAKSSILKGVIKLLLRFNEEYEYLLTKYYGYSPPTWPWQGDNNVPGHISGGGILPLLCWGHKAVNKDETDGGFKDHDRMLDFGNISIISSNMQMLK